MIVFSDSERSLNQPSHVELIYYGNKDLIFGLTSTKG